MANTYTKGGSDDTWVFPGALTVTGTFTAAGPENWTLDATEEAIQVDAYTTPHTGANIVDIRTDVASSSVKVFNVDVNVTSALDSGEKVYGAYIDINGKSDDNAASEFAAFYATSANTTASTSNTGVQLAGAWDMGLWISGTTTADGILINNTGVDGIHVSGAQSENALHISGDQAVGILFDVDVDATDGLKLAIDTGKTVTTGINLLGAGTGAATTGISIACDGTTGLEVTSAFSGVTMISLAGTGSGDGILVSGACADGVHISGTNTASGLHISGNQADAILIDVDAATANGISIAVDEGITLDTGISMACTTTGTITNAISLSYTANATEALAVTVASGKTLTTGASFSGAGAYTTGLLFDSAGTTATAIHMSGAVTTGINIGASTMTTGISIGYTGVTYSTGIALGVTNGTLTTGMNVVGTMTTGINFASAAAIGTFINATGACAALATRGIFIGEDSNSTGSAIKLNGASWATSQGNAFYSDDGGVAATGYTETMTVRHLSTTTVASGDVSFTPLHTDLYLNASYTGTGGLSSIWGNTTIASGKSVDTSGGLGDVGGASFGIDIVGTLAVNSHACGCSVGVGGSGTKTGILSGFRVRGATGTVDWDAFLSIEDGDGSWTSMTTAGNGKTPSLGTAGPTGSDSAPAYWMNMYIGTTKYYFPVWAAT